MPPLKQNLFLFFEENERRSVIDRNLVLLYANRCIIDEDDEFEICGVYQLQKVSDLMFNFTKPLYKTHAKQRTYKESFDRNIMSDAFERAHLYGSNSIDTHFIFGSSFHAFEIEWPTVSINRPEKLMRWMYEEMRSQEIKMVHVTLLAGYRACLSNKEMCKATYDGIMVMHFHGLNPYSVRPNGSVNDDFELTINQIRHGKRLQERVNIFLFPMLAPHELKLINANDESYLLTFSHYLNGFSADVPLEDLAIFPDSDSKVRFVRCLCVRKSFYLNNNTNNTI